MGSSAALVSPNRPDTSASRREYRMFGLEARRAELRATFAALFRLCDSLGIAELVDDEVPRRPLHDVLDLLVFVSRRNHEAVVLFMCLVVFGAGDIERRVATVLAAFGDDLEAIVRSAPNLLAHALDLEVDRAVHRLVAGDALLASVHGKSLWQRRLLLFRAAHRGSSSTLVLRVKLLADGYALVLLEDDSAGQLMAWLDQVLLGVSPHGAVVVERQLEAREAGAVAALAKKWDRIAPR